MKIINTDTLKEYEVDTIKLFQKLVDYKYTDYLLKYTITFYPLITCFYINNHTNEPGGEVTVKFNTDVTICDSSFLQYILTDDINEIILNDEENIKNISNFIEDGVLSTDRVFDSFSDYMTYYHKFFNEFDIGTKIYIKSESKAYILSSHYNLIDVNEYVLKDIKDKDTFILNDLLKDDVIFQKIDKLNIENHDVGHNMQILENYIPVRIIHGDDKFYNPNHIQYLYKYTNVKKIHVTQTIEEFKNGKKI